MRVFALVGCALALGCSNSTVVDAGDASDGAIESGAADVTTEPKPIDAARLVDSVERLLGTKALSAQGKIGAE